MTFFKHAIITLVLAAAIGLAVAAWIIVGGRFDVSVSAQLPRPIHDLIHQTRVNAVQREIRDLETQPVDLDQRRNLLTAVAGFEQHCAGCHSSPGGPVPVLADLLNPPPADLVEAAGKRSFEELYWVTRHGIRMSAMPGWGEFLDETELRAIVTLVSDLPQYSDTEYALLLQAARARRPSEARTGAP